MPRAPEYFPSASGLDERRYPYAIHLLHDADVPPPSPRSQAVAATSPTVSHRGSAALHRLSHQETPRKGTQLGTSCWLQAIFVLGLRGLGPEGLGGGSSPAGAVVFIVTTVECGVDLLTCTIM